MLVFKTILLVTEQYSQTNFPILKELALEVNKIKNKKEWQTI